MNGEKPYVTVIGKGSKIRSMYLMSGLVDTLRKYIAVYHGEDPNPDDYLFYSSWHGAKAKLSQEAVRKRLKIYAVKAHEVCSDVPFDLHSHQWRHAKACHWLEDGINIVEISKLLGHESLETTMIYQEITREKQIRALATLDEEISKGTPKKWKQPNAKNLRDYFCFV
jgi:site-specific recombinase XerD